MLAAATRDINQAVRLTVYTARHVDVGSNMIDIYLPNRPSPTADAICLLVYT